MIPTTTLCRILFICVLPCVVSVSGCRVRKYCPVTLLVDHLFHRRRTRPSGKSLDKQTKHLHQVNTHRFCSSGTLREEIKSRVRSAAYVRSTDPKFQRSPSVRHTHKAILRSRGSCRCASRAGFRLQPCGNATAPQSGQAHHKRIGIDQLKERRDTLRECDGPIRNCRDSSIGRRVY